MPAVADQVKWWSSNKRGEWRGGEGGKRDGENEVLMEKVGGWGVKMAKSVMRCSRGLEQLTPTERAALILT